LYRVTGTSCLIAFIAYSPQLTGLITSAPRWRLVLFNALVGLIWYNYARVVNTDPGGVPPGWSPQQELIEMRFCKKCEVLKPPRAHHCRYCKRCVSL
jgi:palmitoyltransferase